MAPTSMNTRSTKVFTTGTHRVRHPDQTWHIVAPKLPRYGITRVADVTGLDVIGIPVVMAVRPLAKSLSVSQGKGQTPQLARVSAIMEAIELWHVEYAAPQAVHRNVPARELHLPYPVTDLTSRPGSLITDRTPLDWVGATGLLSGDQVPVPTESVGFESPDRRRWLPPGFVHTSNGLASGNSVQEAALHALYEIVERDATADLPPGSLGGPVDQPTIDDESCRELIDRIRRADVLLTLCHMPSRFGVPCFSAQVWSSDFPIRCRGYGAHLDPAVAASRAVTEAVQSRLTAIAGSRDDLPSIYGHVRLGRSAPPDAPEGGLPWRNVANSPRSFTDVAEEVAWVASTVGAGCRGQEPLIADLSTDDEFAVVRVIAPGTALDLDHLHPER